MKSPVNRGGLRFYLVMVSLAACRATPTTVLWALPFVLAGVAIHLWAKGCLHQNLEVTNTGPYRFVRHPFYSANALVDIGIAIMSGWWVIAAALPAWWLLVYIPVIRSEEAYLTSVFPDKYPAYRAKVSMLLPLGRPLPRIPGGFTIHNPNISSGMEIPRVLRLLSYPLLFLVWSMALEQRSAFFSHINGWHLAAVMALVSVHMMAWELERHLRHGRRVLPEFLANPKMRVAAVVVILAAALLITRLEVELHAVTVAVGTALVAASLVVGLKWKDKLLLAEALALAGVAFLSELIWLSAVPIVMYAALLMDSRLYPELRETLSRRWRLWPSFLPSGSYCLILLGGLAVVIAKELIFG